MFDVDDDLILDDNFASFLNQNKEIIVSDTLYRYTEIGIYKTHKSNLQTLRTRLEGDLLLLPEYQDTPSFPGEYPIDIEPEKRLVIVIPTPDPCGVSAGQIGISDAIAPINQNEFQSLLNPNCFTFGGTSGSNGGSSSSQDHNQNMLDYINNLTPCETSNNLMGIFGPDKRCWSAFNGSRRTKTVFWKHNYLIYKSIGTKVKHQKKHTLGWWYASKADEIALMVNFTYFKLKPNYNPQQVHSFINSQKVYIYDGKFYNSASQMIGAAGFSNELPSLPNQAEVTISEVINSVGLPMTPDRVKKFFYDNTWNQVKSLVQSMNNRPLSFPVNMPQNVNYYLYDINENVIHYIYLDLGYRGTNIKKITKTFDYTFSVGVTFNFYDFLSGTLTVKDLKPSFNLWDYKDARAEVIGVSRKGNDWRGSKLIFVD